jgi:hypothetical protein
MWEAAVQQRASRLWQTGFAQGGQRAWGSTAVWGGGARPQREVVKRPAPAHSSDVAPPTDPVPDDVPPTDPVPDEELDG